MNKVAAFALRRKNSILSMSEKMFCPPQPLRLVWVTPACAGKRQTAAMPRTMTRDHPRVYGEKNLLKCVLCSHGGSPPRMRGKDVQLDGAGGRAGITPAYAGKSCASLRWAASRRDHPRVCGEKFSNASVVWSLTGSPPRVRGKDFLHHRCGRRPGITPAHAGKSSASMRVAASSEDHPRVCGEKA